MRKYYYDLSPIDIYKIIRISEHLRSPAQVILAFDAAIKKQKDAEALFLEEEEGDELSVDNINDVPDKLQPIANALYGAIEGNVDPLDPATSLQLA